MHERNIMKAKGSRKQKRKVSVWGGFGEKKSNGGTQWYIQVSSLDHIHSELLDSDKRIMKVYELIRELCNYNQDAEVVTPHSETICIGYIATDSECNIYDQRDTLIVFIEGCDYVEEDD